jgi:hypothetical protein
MASGFCGLVTVGVFGFSGVFFFFFNVLFVCYLCLGGAFTLFINFSTYL